MMKSAMMRMGVLLLLLLLLGRVAAQRCSDLGLIAHESVIDSGVAWAPHFAADAQVSKVVLVVSNAGTLYRSSDDGMSFVQMFLPRAGATDNGNETVSDIFFSAAAHERFYVMGRSAGFNVFWTTEDGGRTFQAMNDNEQTFVWLLPHFKLRDVALAFSYGRQQETITWLTIDFGKSWARVGVTGSTFQSHFGCEDLLCERRTRVVVEQSSDGGPWDPLVGGELVAVPFDPAAADSAAALDDSARTLISTTSTGVSEVHWPWYDLHAHRVTFRAELVDAAAQTQRVYYSHHGALSWIEAKFPFGLEKHQMQFVTTESDVVLAAVRPIDASGELEYGDLYVSANDRANGEFALSLRNVRYTRRRWWEDTHFAGVLSVERSSELDGVLLANRFATHANGSVNQQCLQTMLTLDYGATWQRVRAPSGNGELLNFFLSPLDWPSAYSPSDAVGVWLARGRVGECLDRLDTESATPTYYSHDAGLSWVVANDGPFIYEVSNHGALVAGAVTDRATAELVYTTDNGNTFETCSFDDKISAPFVVENILTRSFNARNFLMHGVSADDNAGESSGVLLLFEFKQLKNCTDADYEDWQVADCLLGKQVIWSRRKPTAECTNAVEYEASMRETVCECTEADYECDFCYEFDERARACAPVRTPYCDIVRNNAPHDQCFEPGTATYIESDGYRKQPNNVCVDGVQHGVEKPCTDVHNGTPILPTPNAPSTDNGGESPTPRGATPGSDQQQPATTQPFEEDKPPASTGIKPFWIALGVIALLVGLCACCAIAYNKRRGNDSVTVA